MVQNPNPICPKNLSPIHDFGSGRVFLLPAGAGMGVIVKYPTGSGAGTGRVLGFRVRGRGVQYPAPTRPVAIPSVEM